MRQPRSKNDWSKNVNWRPAGNAIATAKIQPVGEDEFAGLLADVGLTANSGPIAVALSGGGDSMALCLLSHGWAKAHSVRLTALTVDHQLRAGSAEEAQTVSGWLKSLTIDHRILTWTGDKPTTGIQAAARDARYSLMAEWMRDNDASDLLVAHQLEDQAQTFLMRIGGGSGIDGLACMSNVATREINGIALKLVRPLLGVARERLRQTLRERDQAWLEDPSNRNPAYARTGLRVLSSKLDAVGVPAERLVRLIDQFSRLRNYMGAAVDVFIDRACTYHRDGYAVVNARLLIEAPGPIAERVLIRIVRAVGGGETPPRSNRVANAIAKIHQGDGFKGCTLGGCRIISADNDIMICREFRRIWPSPVNSDAESLIWDRRFKIKFEKPSVKAGSAVYLGPLGLAGWRQIVSEHPDLKGIIIPHPARLVMPALFDDRGVFQVPGLGYLRRNGAGYPVKVITAEFLPLINREIKIYNASE